METPFDTKKRNDGYSTKRLREILGIKQEELAEKLGLSQQAVSKIEQSEILKDEQLELIAKSLNVPVDAIKNYSEGSTANFINTFYDNSGFNYQCKFNPFDKVIELYERVIQTEREKVSLLEEILKSKK